MVDIINTSQLTSDAPIVVGFFTLDQKYGLLAKNFSANLLRHDIPHHLYAVSPPIGGWNEAIKTKPAITQRALSEYPNRPVIQCDVDCSFRGRPNLQFLSNNVDAWLAWRPKKRGMYGWLINARVIVWSPTDGAFRLAKQWERACREDGVPNDEIALTRVVCEGWVPNISFGSLERRFSGIEIDRASTTDVIVHESAAKTGQYRPLHKRAVDQLKPLWKIVHNMRNG